MLNSIRKNRQNQRTHEAGTVPLLQAEGRSENGASALADLSDEEQTMTAIPPRRERR